MNTSKLEQKLIESLRKDRTKPSRCKLDGDTIMVTISGLSSGLLLALSWATGEDEDTILARMDDGAQEVL